MPQLQSTKRAVQNRSWPQRADSMKLAWSASVALVALLAGIAVCQGKRAQAVQAGAPVEMSSMAITFYNSGE